MACLRCGCGSSGEIWRAWRLRKDQYEAQPCSEHSCCHSLTDIDMAEESVTSAASKQPGGTAWIQQHTDSTIDLLVIISLP